MSRVARELPDQRCYNLSEAAEFLGFDETSVAYWLRMGHLPGTWDSQRECWSVRPDELLAFLRAAGEPFPTGARARIVRPKPSFDLRPVAAFPGVEELTD